MQPQVSAILNSLALTRLPPLRQAARLRELATDAFILSEVMHVADARQALVGAAVTYVEVADELERQFYPASRRH